MRPTGAQSPRLIEYRHWSEGATERWGFVEGDRFYPYLARINAERDADLSREELEQKLAWVPLSQTCPFPEPKLAMALATIRSPLTIDSLRRITGAAIIVFLLLLAELVIGSAMRGCTHGQHPLPATGDTSPILPPSQLCPQPGDPCQPGEEFDCQDANGSHEYVCEKPWPAKSKI